MKNNCVFIFALWCAIGYSQQDQIGFFCDANGKRVPTNQTFQSTAAETLNPSEISFGDVRELSEINNEDGQGYPWISGDGLRLYYIHNISGGSEILYAERPDDNSNFTAPVAVMPSLPITPVSVWISTDELQAYVCNVLGGIYYLNRNSAADAFGTPVVVTLIGNPGVFFAGLSFSPDQTEMYAFTSFPDAVSRFTKTDTATFTYTGTLAFGDGIAVSPGQLSKDGLHFIASTGTTTLGRTLKLLSRETTSDAFDGTAAELIGGLDDANVLGQTQASVSNNMEWIAFIRNSDGSWNSNRLYLAHNTQLSVSQNDPKRAKITMYPNPSGGIVHFDWDQKTDAELEIFDSLGQSILKQPMADRIDLTPYGSGIYFAKITTPDSTETKKIIRQ